MNQRNLNALYSMVICGKSTKFSVELLVTLCYPIYQSRQILVGQSLEKTIKDQTNIFLFVFVYCTCICPRVHQCIWGFLKHFLVLKGLVLPFRPSFVNRWSELTWIDHIITYRRTWTGTESKSQRGLSPRKLQWWLMSTYTKNNKQTNKQFITIYIFWFLFLRNSRSLTPIGHSHRGLKLSPYFWSTKCAPLNIKSCILT